MTEKKNDPSLEDQLDELKGALGQEHLSDYLVFSMSVTEERILGALMARQWIAKESLISILYSAQPDADRPDDRTLDVHISHVRKKLKKKGVTLSTRYGDGWLLKEVQKEKVRTIIANFQREEQLALDAAKNGFVIEKGVPVPVDTRASKYPFTAMEIGDSFVLKGRKKSTAYSAARGFRKNHSDVKFKVRIEGSGVRIWRIK